MALPEKCRPGIIPQNTAVFRACRKFLALTAREAYSRLCPLLSGTAMILNAIAERLKRGSKDDFRGRHFEASPLGGGVSKN